MMTRSLIAAMAAVGLVATWAPPSSASVVLNFPNFLNPEVPLQLNGQN
jgi:hypothetical protein